MLQKIGNGLIAGVIATAVMDTSQTTLIPAVSSWIKAARGRSSDGASMSIGGTENRPESSPEKVAHRIADRLGISLSRDEVSVWGNRLHWLYGTQWAAQFAVLDIPRKPLAGSVFGAILWLGSDELLLWGLGIAETPTHYPLESHLSALAAHVIYGTVVGITLAGLEASISSR